MTHHDFVFRFSYERMDVYQVAREFVRWVHLDLFPRLPNGYSKEKDQLHRASLSVMLNIAEGAEQESFLNKRKHYRIARGSAGECAAVLDALRVMGITQLEIGERLIRRTGGMLFKLSRKTPPS